MFNVDRQKGLKLMEIAEDVTVDDVKTSTGCPFEVHMLLLLLLLLLFMLDCWFDCCCLHEHIIVVES